MSCLLNLFSTVIYNHFHFQFLESGCVWSTWLSSLQRVHSQQIILPTAKHATYFIRSEISVLFKESRNYLTAWKQEPICVPYLHKHYKLSDLIFEPISPQMFHTADLSVLISSSFRTYCIQFGSFEKCNTHKLYFTPQQPRLLWLCTPYQLYTVSLCKATSSRDCARMLWKKDLRTNT